MPKQDEVEAQQLLILNLKITDLDIFMYFFALKTPLIAMGETNLEKSI